MDQTVFSTRQIYRDAPSGTKIGGKKEPAIKLISLLVEYGWLKPAPKGTLVYGKECKEAWILQEEYPNGR